jgi:SAM-dependent methyltransferase
MEPGRRRERAASFGPAADLYDQVRPTYPAQAVAWALAPLGAGRWRVADIGAGTGIMTRVLLGLGRDVVAVEPDELMRARLLAATPQVEAVPGAAESMPFADGDLDAAVAAQAYHWFDLERAHSELSRVIRPGGVFAAIWNERDESTAWVEAYSRAVDGDRQWAEHKAPPDFGDLFTPVEMGVFHHAVPQTPDSLIAQLQTRSYYLTATADRQQALVDEVRDLARTHPDLAGRSQFPLPYETRVFRAVRR